MKTNKQILPTREGSSTLTMKAHKCASTMLLRGTDGIFDPGSTSGRATGSVPTHTPTI